MIFSLLSRILETFHFIWIILIGIVDSYIYKFKIFDTGTSNNEGNIENQVVVITGGQRGIGKAVAIEFAKRGAVVVLGCVDLKEGLKTQEEIKKITGNKSIDLVHLDLSEMASVRKFAEAVQTKYPDIKILWNNAGLGAAANGINVKTKDGFNLHMSVNYLGHFLLTNLLVPNLKKGSRVVATSSTIQLMSRLDLDDFMMDHTSLKVSFDNGLPYANSKFALSLFINELGRRLKHKGVTTCSFCPGIVKTAIYAEAGFAFKALAYLTGFTTEEACDGILYCALDRSLKDKSGQMFRFKKPYSTANARYDPILCEKVWNLSAKLVKL